MSSSLSKTPSWFSQVTPQQVLAVLRQPSAIAVLASIVVHGLLAATLPLLPMKPEEPKKPRATKVLALTPAEQGRLGIGKGYGSGNGNGLGSANSLPDFLPPSFPIPTPSTSPFYSFPTDPPVPPIDSYPIDSTRQSSSTTSPGTTEPAPKPSASGKPSPTGGGGGGNGGNSAETCPTPPDSSPACKKIEKDRKIAQLRDKYASSRTKELTSDETFTEYNKNWQPFAQTLSDVAGADYKDLGTQTNVPDQLPPEACPFIKGKPRAQVGVIVKPDGTLHEVVLLNSSGYKALDDIAKAYAATEALKLKKSNTFKTTQYPFTFDPEDPRSKCSPGSTAN